jgi:class 3 adenylate cyclase/TolB-like protein/ketosteroid isomerase-like protein
VDGPDERYTRRISAVLVADVSGFSALMGLDDERTARDVLRIQTVVRTIVSDLQGHAEPKAGDSIFASFESVVSAVDAALRIQRQLAEESEPDRPVRLRIGVHFGDVLHMPAGTAFGDAINVAARLCALARPGTVCVSAGVYRQVRTRFDDPVEDLGRQRLKNISDPVHAYLIVPRHAGAAHRRARRIVPWVIGGVVVVMLATAASVLVSRLRAPAEHRIGLPLPTPPRVVRQDEGHPGSEDGEIVLGVMLFKANRDDKETAWMRDALRDGLNTQLSGLSKVTVYSKEFIDFLMTREGLSEIEAATKLGIRKMLSGSYVAVGDNLRIETHVVDVTTGRLEAAVSTTGPVSQFLRLQTQMTEEVIARLNLPITEEERKTLLARQSSDVEALKLLLEAEGGGAKPPRGPDSALERWIARAVQPTLAWADDTADITHVVDAYRKAIESRDITALNAVYVDLPQEQQAAQQRYFDNAKDLKVKIEDVKVAVSGEEAVVIYTRTDDFADARTGQPMHVSVRLTKNLKRTAEGWRIAGK